MSYENFKFAVVAAARWWWSCDYLHLSAFEVRDKFSPELVREIGKDYKVIRGFSSREPTEDAMFSVKGIARLLNDRLDNWPDGLVARAKHCATLADEASGKFTKRSLASAMTKLMWFARPHGWTMFDRLAADGLEVDGTAGVSRMLSFYEKLHELEYETTLRTARHALPPKLNALLAERILDKYFVLAGQTIRDGQGYNDLFLDGLPDETAGTLLTVARDLDEACADCKLIHFLDIRTPQ